MNILVFHRYRPWSTGHLMVKALERDHFVWEKNTEQVGTDNDNNYLWMDDLKWYKKNMKIDVVLGIGCQDRPHGDFKERIKEAGLISAVWLMDDPLAWEGFRNPVLAQQFDILFVAQKDLIPKYMELADNPGYVTWLNFGADPSVWRPIRGEKRWDMYFCGGAYSAHGYPKRHEWIERLKEQGHNVKATYGRYLREYNSELNMSLIGYNHAFTDELNMRCYEVALSGIMLLTQDIEYGFRDTFTPGKDCVVFDGNSWEDMRDKFIWYRDHDKERERIARAGYQLVINNYTYQHRAREMVRVIEKFLRKNQ